MWLCGGTKAILILFHILIVPSFSLSFPLPLFLPFSLSLPSPSCFSLFLLLKHFNYFSSENLWAWGFTLDFDSGKHLVYLTLSNENKAWNSHDFKEMCHTHSCFLWRQSKTATLCLKICCRSKQIMMSSRNILIQRS